MKTLFEFLKNPFYRVAGYTSLVWGVVGIVVSTAIAFLGDIHFHGLLHYGGAPNGAWWCFVVEHLVVWLVPSVLIYLSALFCRRCARWLRYSRRRLSMPYSPILLGFSCWCG